MNASNANPTEFTVAPIVDDPDTGNLTDPVVRNAAATPNRVVMVKRSGQTWTDVTADAFCADIRAVAKGIIASGVAPGDRVALMSRTRYEWTVADYAIWFAGAATVPIYETSSAEQVEWILSDSGATATFLENDKHAALLAEVADRVPQVTRSWIFDSGALSSLKELGQNVTDDELEARRTSLTPESLATIIYTSGTTGRPKGCAITHRSFRFEARTIVEMMPDVFKAPNASTLMFLPLAHVFGRAIQLGVVEAGVRTGHTSDVKTLVQDFAAFKPTFVLAVPRVFEKIYNGAGQRAAADGKGTIFQTAADTAIAYSEALDKGGAGFVLKAKHTVFDKLVYSKLRTSMGGQLQWAVSGGAPLGSRLGHFFRGAGIIVLEGYGLTETCAGTTLNRPASLSIGSVGQPIPGSSVRIAEDGEVLLKGPHIFSGYWQNPEATAEAITDGWFHSGDLGELDAEGFLRITGRKKEILVTAGGKNVAPAVLEDRIRADWLVSQCMVVGDKQPFIAALVTIDPESWSRFLSDNGKPADTTIASCVDDPVLRTHVQGVIDQANKAVSHAEAIKKFVILDDDWTEEGGQLTPSMKLKRSVVLTECADEVAAIYS